MTDRKMLELAARAAGYEVRSDGEGGLTIRTGAGRCRDWNPLEDDGDALRLQVALRFSPEFGNDAVTIWPVKERYTERPDGVSSIEERCAATRLAITRAAAEIGRQKKETT